MPSGFQWRYRFSVIEPLSPDATSSSSSRIQDCSENVPACTRGKFPGKCAGFQCPVSKFSLLSFGPRLPGGDQCHRGGRNVVDFPTCALRHAAIVAMPPEPLAMVIGKAGSIFGFRQEIAGG